MRASASNHAQGVYISLSSNSAIFIKARAGDRAPEFEQRCAQLKIHGKTLHSYRYDWAERAKTAG